MVGIITEFEKTAIPPLEIVGRTAIYVFYSSYKYVRQLSRFGDLGYSSKKARYALLYVDTAMLEAVVPKLTALHFVKAVKISEFDHLNRDFSSAFQETVQEAKNEENQKAAEL
ncbi:YlbG family protein [Pseudolactococcus yaeyamensis]